MAESLVAGAAIGAAFEILFKTVIDATQKVANFNSDLNKLRLTLYSIKPAIEDVGKFNRILDRPQEETQMFADRLIQGEKLVQKCLKVKWNVCKRLYYSNKLAKLEASLVRFFQIDVAALNFRESKKISVGVSELDLKMNELVKMMQGNAICGGNSKGFSGWCGVPGEPEYVVGLEQPLQELRDMLLEDGEHVVVLSAPGGCGKTTLAKKLCHDQQIKGHFGENIFFVTVSRSPNLGVIVQRIFQTIEKYQVPDFQGDEDPINQLEQLFLRRIGQNPILLVLDDVWSGPSGVGAESLIEKFIFKRPQYKILVTSRVVFHRFNTYKLKLLSDQQAMELFHHWAFKGGVCSVSSDLVDKAVGACGGLPLALKVVGGSLYGKPEIIWMNRISLCSNGQSILHMSSELYNCLKSSVDTLDEMPILKECYLDLGSFPEDQKIPIATLLDMWVELYNLDEEGIYALAYLYELFTRNLVDLATDRRGALTDTDYISEQFAMQHDLLRELAIYLSEKEPVEYRRRVLLELKENHIPQWWLARNPQPVQAKMAYSVLFQSLCRKLEVTRPTLISDETFFSVWDDIEVPNVQVFMLNLQTRAYTLPPIIRKMSHLKVLIMTNDGSFPADVGDFPPPDHLLNLKRIRLERVSICSVATSIFQLRNLRKISLIMCSIGEAFQSCTLDSRNIWPNLVELVIDYIDDLAELPIWFCKLVHLKKATISHCPELIQLPQDLGNLTNMEVLRLHSCTSLPELPESIGGLRKLRFLDLSDCVGMENLPEQIGQLQSLRKLDMRGCRGLFELPPSVANLVRLEHVICDEETAYLWDYHEDGCTNLRISVVKEEKSLNWLHSI